MGHILMIVGTVAVALGILWILQGAGYVGGSFMTNERRWIYIGAATALVGVVLLVAGFRPRRW